MNQKSARAKPGLIFEEFFLFLSHLLRAVTACFCSSFKFPTRAGLVERIVRYNVRHTAEAKTAVSEMMKGLRPMPPTQTGGCRAASLEQTWTSQANVRASIELIKFVNLNKLIKRIKLTRI